MQKVYSGIIAGLIFGLISVLLMISIKFDDKKSAMIGSFINRFAIGFFIATTNLPVSSWGKGLLIGLLLSLPDAIITKSYVPIIGVGAVGGTLIGLIIR